MSTYEQTALETAVTEGEPSQTDDECDECAALPGKKELPEEGGE